MCIYYCYYYYSREEEEEKEEPTSKMASLTPGTLNKLLQNLGNQDFKVAGEHRSALLQVISIVPSLEDDPWKSRGYFLRVSDSLHSAYVSVSDEDAELILNDKIQLGQFIHVTRLDSCSPVPLLKGLKPIPKRRPCVGEPQDLISSDFLSAKVEVKAKPKGKSNKPVENAADSVRRLSLGNGKARGLESRRLSFDSARRGWDTSPRSEKGGRGAKDKSNYKFSRLESVGFNKVSPQDSPNLLSISPLKSKNIIIVTPKLVPTPTHVKNLKSSDDDVIFPSDFSKVTITTKSSSDSIMLWNSLPSAICDLGKKTRSFRNAAFGSAVHALEEASIHESVLRCMSMFAEVCESSQNNSSGPLVEQFLNLHESMDKSSKVMSHLISNIKNSNSNKSTDLSSQLTIPNASLWVQAALETDLSKFSLYTKGEKGNSTNPDKHHFVVLENNTTPEKTNTENQPKKAVSKGRRLCNGKGMINAGHEKWSRGSGLRHTDILLRKLISCSRAWFLDYLEDCLTNGFGVKNRNEDEDSNVKVLGQLKRVNKWLDEGFRGEGSVDDERVRRLRTKIYRFLLDNVDSAVPRR